MCGCVRQRLLDASCCSALSALPLRDSLGDRILDGHPRLGRTGLGQAPIQRLVDDAHAATGNSFLEHEAVAEYRADLDSGVGIFGGQYVLLKDVRRRELVIVRGRFFRSGRWHYLAGLFDLLTACGYLFRNVPVEHRLYELKCLFPKVAGFVALLQRPTNLGFVAAARLEQAADAVLNIGKHLQIVRFGRQPVVENSRAVPQSGRVYCPNLRSYAQHWCDGVT